MVLSRVSEESKVSQPKYEIVKQEVRRRIDNGSWRPGDLITSERDLAEELAVSRITVKHSIADLISEGLLLHIPGKRGTFVSDRKSSPPATSFIGAAIDDIRDSFGSELLRGIEDFFWDRKFHTLLCNSDRNFTKIEEYFNSLIEHEIAGVIFSPVIDHGYTKNNARLISFLQRHRLPFVLVDRYVPGILANYVGVNHRESSRQIVGELIRAGHRRILISVGLDCTSMDERLQGYRDSLEEAEIEIDESLVIRNNDSLLYHNPDRQELDRMKEQIAGAGEVSCFYALNSRLLNGGLQVLNELGMKPGIDVRIASHDEIRKAGIGDGVVEKPYAVQPCYRMGWEAARILLDHISMPEAPVVQMTLKASVVEARD